MAVPKRRQSSTRGKKRRTHDSLTAVQTVQCPQCREPKLPHHLCPSCGTYKGRQVIETGD